MSPVFMENTYKQFLWTVHISPVYKGSYVEI